MREPIDLNEYKKHKEKMEKEKSDLKLFQELTSKPVKDLSPEQRTIYNEIGVVCGFEYKEQHRVLIVLFRGVYYLLNMLNGGVFEYIGKMDDIIDNYIDKFN